MKVIEQAANQTEEAIKNLETSIMEISGFADEISQITGQTKKTAIRQSNAVRMCGGCRIKWKNL